MTQYRKKPVVIEASQWFKNGDHPLDYSKDHEGLEGGEMRVFTGAERKSNSWEGDIVRYFRHPDVDSETPCKHCGVRMHEHGWIDTLEGGHIVCPGDWIITGVKGEHYPCKPDIFAATYDLEGQAPKLLALPVIDPGMVPQTSDSLPIRFYGVGEQPVYQPVHDRRIFKLRIEIDVHNDADGHLTPAVNAALDAVVSHPGLRDGDVKDGRLLTMHRQKEGQLVTVDLFRHMSEPPEHEGAKS